MRRKNDLKGVCAVAESVGNADPFEFQRLLAKLDLLRYLEEGCMGAEASGSHLRNRPRVHVMRKKSGSQVGFAFSCSH
jgi:hypothetical protein